MASEAVKQRNVRKKKRYTSLLCSFSVSPAEITFNLVPRSHCVLHLAVGGLGFRLDPGRLISVLRFTCLDCSDCLSFVEPL